MRMVRAGTRATVAFVKTTVRLLRLVPYYVDYGLDLWDEVGPVETVKYVIGNCLSLLKRVLLHVLA